VEVTSLPRFDTQRLPPKKAVRMGDEGKAVGANPPTALLFVALRQRLRSILILCKRHRLIVVGVGPRMSEFLHDIPNFEGSRAPLARPFLSCAICEQPRQSMQDQKNQTRDQHNGRDPCYREHQCLRRRVVTYTLAFHC